MKIDRIIAWSAFVIANAALLFVIAVTINNQYESGYNTRRIEEIDRRQSTLQDQINTYRVYVETLHSAMAAKGIQAPAPPVILSTQPPTSTSTRPQQKQKEK